jgi:hypothetical protein
MTSLTLYTKLETLPSNLKNEATDFIESLVQKNSTREKVEKSKPKFGSLKGEIILSDDFDAPLEIFKDYM